MMAMSESKKRAVREANDRVNRNSDLKRFFPAYPMMLDANWDRETALYLAEGRMTGIVCEHMAGRSDIVSVRRF